MGRPLFYRLHLRSRCRVGIAPSVAVIGEWSDDCPRTTNGRFLYPVSGHSYWMADVPDETR